jgi:squalene-hopene/tetraprenyl-beta-curcumene cyclase
MTVATRGALGQAVEWLLDHQHPEGWWSGELETNVTMTAEHVLLCRFLGVDLEHLAQGAVEHIIGCQREDGSWALYHDGPADLSTTIEAYAALKALGVDAASDPMTRALRVVQRMGGLAQARVFTRIWLALFGEYPWQGVPSMPPELISLPAWAPLNLYDFACWARGTIAPLLVVLSRKPVRKLGVGLEELVVPGSESLMHRVPGSGPFWWLDQLLKLYEWLPWQPGRRLARRRVIDWIKERQEADGSWGGIQPPWVYSLIALDLEGVGLDHPVMRRGVAGLDRFALSDSGGWRLQACMSPVWDTAWAVRALVAAGGQPGDEPLRRAVDWLLAEQIPGGGAEQARRGAQRWGERSPHARAFGGDWKVRCPGVTDCGGWAFEFENDIYPDIDDTAVIVCALGEAAGPRRAEPAVARAVQWVRHMRSRNGAWAAFDRDNTRQLVYRLPFADFGAMLDPPTEDVTAHVLEMLACVGAGTDDPMVRGGLDYLRRTQRADGSWFGRWGVNHIYGTWCVISALTALGTGGPMLERACRWLISRQNPDGGWGETCHSYVDPSFAGIGDSTPSQTAWAVIGLLLAGRAEHPASRRGLEFLRERQVEGTWDEPQFTGTGFPGDFYINYHLYRHIFPTMALAMAGVTALKEG